MAWGWVVITTAGVTAAVTVTTVGVILTMGDENSEISREDNFDLDTVVTVTTAIVGNSGGVDVGIARVGVRVGVGAGIGVWVGRITGAAATTGGSVAVVWRGQNHQAGAAIIATRAVTARRTITTSRLDSVLRCCSRARRASSAVTPSGTNSTAILLSITHTPFQLRISNYQLAIVHC
ncbi:MAG: hypothetical protein DRJ03_16300 [Chloroflexi bacterium]|nr:MAG: hypothetical protein DRJ03_16300 [Chloroflexota bacterium]